MKTIKYILFAFLATFTLAGCSDDLTYVGGENEDPDCYGVYFPTQEQAGDIELDPADPMKITFTARRAKSEGAITVPVDVSGTDDVFTASALQFADGQEESTFTISFESAAIGKTYECSVVVTDPGYVSIYGERAAGFDFSITRVKWNDVDADKTITYQGQPYKGYEWYTDDVVTALFNLPGDRTYPVKVQVRDDSVDPDYPNGPNGLAGIYRMVEPYGALYPFNEPGDYTPGVNIIINAEDPQKVYIDDQLMGADWGYGAMSIWSQASYYLQRPSQGKPDAFYGKIEAGAITFPEKALFFSMANQNDGALYYANTNGAFRLVVCQDQEVDYSLVLSAGEPSRGVVKIKATLGVDVTKVKYAFFEGSLTASMAAEGSANIESGDVVSKEITAAGTIEAQLEKTGMYTIVANIYDKAGKLYAHKYLTFGYAKDNADVPVTLTVGSIVSDKHKPQGATAENSVELYLYGEGITKAKWFLTRSSNFEGIPPEYWAGDMAGTYGIAFTDAQLAEINGKGFSGVIDGLNPGVDYTIAVWAYNDYLSDAFVTEFKTAGTHDPLQYFGWNEYDVGWIYQKSMILKTWNLWAVDGMDENATGRTKFGQLTISENTVDDEPGYDYVDVSGLSLGESESDAIKMEFYNNFLLVLKGQQVYEKGGNKIGYYVMSDKGNLYKDNDGLMVGGFIDEGYMAFITNASATGTINCNGIALRAFSDEVYGTPVGWVAILSELMLEDPAKAQPQSQPKVATQKQKQLEQLAAALATPANYVELRGRERAHALIDEIVEVKSQPRSLSTSLRRVEMPAMKAVDLKSTFTPGIASDQVVDRKMKTKGAAFVK